MQSDTKIVNPFEGKDPKEVWLQIKANSTTRDKVVFFEEAVEYLNKKETP